MIFGPRQIEALTEAARRFSRPHLNVPQPPENRLGSDLLFRSLAGLTPQQMAIRNDESRYIFVGGTRRWGKTYTAPRWFAELGMKAQDPRAMMFFIAPTLQHAKSLLWQEFDVIKRETQLDFERKADPWRVEFPTGAQLLFRGAGDLTELGPLTGFKTLLVWIDECQDIPDVVLRFIAQKIGPGMRDLGGRAVFSGTPPPVCSGYWWEIYSGQPGTEHFSRHRSTLFDNPHLPPEAKDLQVILREEGLTPDMPRFKREYLGECVEDDSLQVYTFNIMRDSSGWTLDSPLPSGHEWHYVMGVDFGFHPDPSAVVVLAYSLTNPVVHVVYEWQQGRKSYTELYEEGIRPAIERFGVMPSVGDAAAPQAITELNQRWQLGMQPCVKGNKAKLKAHWVELVNSLFQRGQLRVPADTKLAKELIGLTWDPKKLPERKEDPRKPNHSADAMLYAAIEAKQWHQQPQVTPPNPFDDSVDAWNQKAAYLLQEVARQRQSNTARDWASDDDWSRS